MELLKSLDSHLDGLEVGHHTAEPSGVYIVSVSSESLFLDGISCLLLSADKKNFLAVSRKIAYKIVSFFKLLYGLLKIDDVDSVSFGENVRCHFRVPSSCLVSEVNACFKKLLH